MQPDLIRILFVTFAFFLLGLTFGYAVEFALFAALICNIWLLFRAERLHNWFTKPNKLPPAEQGVFYQLHRDIGKMRNKHQREKRELQQNLKRAIEASTALPDAVVITHNNGEVSWSNQLAETLLNIKHPRDEGHRVTTLLRHPDFTSAYANHSEEPVNIDFESPTQRDVTMNLKVIDLAHEMQMIVARDISRHIKSARAQKDFVNNVSHELKTPLTVMRGYLEMLEESHDHDSPLHKPFSDMLLQTNRMQSTIEDLLFLSKLESQPKGESQNQLFEKIDINHTLDMVMDSANILAEQNSQKITQKIDPNLNIMGNATELQIAFSNLITNAIRYTPKEGLIEIKWFEREGKAIFSVKDNGIGISPNHISRLTERFYRADQARSREKGGTGLGLSIVKQVLDRHAAKLNIISNLGSGSCFECEFSNVIE
jgi:two-component system phosphate regulon sensor histidine kinase PhoR